MIKEILKSASPKLRNKSKKVLKIDKKINSLIEDLRDTLKAQKDPEGVGLAAPQIGVNLRVFIIKPQKDASVFINPEILSVQKKNRKKTKRNSYKKIMEGCLSLPHYYSAIERSFKVTLRYTNETGKNVTEVFTGIEAQIVEHEVDHLNGILFVDRTLEQKKPLYEYHNGEWEEVEL